MLKSTTIFLYRLGLLIFLLLLWEGVAYYIGNPKLFPGIGYIFSNSLISISVFSDSAGSDVQTAIGVILYHSKVTVLRCMMGFAIGFVGGVLYGLLIHFFLQSKNSTYLLLKIMRNVPLLAMMPLFLYWFGGTETGIVFYIAFAVFIVIATNSYEAIINVPKKFIEHAKMLGASKLRIYSTVILPASFPELFGALKYLTALIWAISLAAEYLTTGEGLGFLIFQSYSFGDMGKLILLSVNYCVLSSITYLILKLVTRKMVVFS